MDETLRKQIDAWTETDEHGRIVDMLGQISPEERDSEATGLLARAYNNLGEYEKALPFRKRVKDFWKWFTDNEEELSRIVENRGQLEVQVSAAYQEDINAFNIHFYEEQLCSLEEAQSYNAYYIMMEIMLGEGLSYQYIASVERADAPLENMIKLPELRAYITDTLKAHGKEIFDNPQQVYTSYRFEPQENEELRFDVMAGSSCFQPLVANYYNGSTELFDRLNGFGAQAVFIAFPYENKEEGDGKKVLDFRYELEDRLAAELLEPEGLGLLLGGAIGTGTCYIDLLLFDESAFMEKIVPFLKDYPQYHFYLSDFRQGSDLCRLYETEDDESEE